MAAGKKSQVSADVKKNRLYITISVDPRREELEKVYTDVRFCVADLQPGFAVITDLRQCAIAHLNGLGIFRKIMKYLVTHHVGEVVRVVGKTSVLIKQLVRFTTVFPGYKVAYVGSLEEAEEWFASSPRRKAIRFAIERRQVEVRSRGESGSAMLIDISTGGCAIAEATIPLSCDDELTLVVRLHKGGEESLMFETAARIVREGDGVLALSFATLDDRQVEELYACLANEVGREVVPL